MTKSKIITYVAVAVLILVGLYWVYHLMNKSSEPEVGGVVAVSGIGLGLSPANSQAAQLIAILNDIEEIDLKDHRILNDKIFTTLQDFGKTIDDRVIGRTNPFASLTEGSGIVRGSNGGAVTNSTTQTTSSTTDEESLFE